MHFHRRKVANLSTSLMGQKRTGMAVILAGILGILSLAYYLMNAGGDHSSNSNSTDAHTPIASRVGQHGMQRPARALPEPTLFRSLANPPLTAGEKAMWDWWHQERQLDPTFRWRRKIQFYGIVVDPSGKPVDGANVTVIVEELDGKKRFELLSDQLGCFELPMQTGKSIYVAAYKKGYVSGQASGGNFEYADFFSPFFHVPSKNSPVILSLEDVTK